MRSYVCERLPMSFACQSCYQPRMMHPAQVAFVIGGLRRQTSTLKPFNPILGETYQGQYSSGLRVFAEQISHHPPVSSWQVEDAEGKVRPSYTNQSALHWHDA